MINNIHTFVVLAYKESIYLEECIKSVLNQTIDTNVVIATTTDNKYIRAIAKKYKLNVIVGKHTTIGGDFDFARLSVKSELVTIAHQDDVYDKNYLENVINAYKKFKNSSIIFTDYYEIRENKIVYTNTNLKIKRILLLPLRIKKIGKFRIFKRFVLRFGNSISCPAVTFVNKNCPKYLFTSDFKSDCDWYAWEKLSKVDKSFTFIPKKLMGHRIDETTTTTDIINSGIRTKEDLEILKKFWPEKIAFFINKKYRKSEKSNKKIQH
mgnify:CR=1 FL=1